MDIHENNTSGLGEETPNIARASHDEDLVSYIKPIIKELVRTQVCFPNIKLLVDKIYTVKVSPATESSGLKAYLMYLTDRHKTIQGSSSLHIYSNGKSADTSKILAVVRRRLHKWFATFDVREGSYVILKEYDLARGKRLHGEGEVLYASIERYGVPILTAASYLAIYDFYSIGEDQRYNSRSELRSISCSADEGASGSLDQTIARDEDERKEVDVIRTESSLTRGSPAKAHQGIASSKDPLYLKPAAVETKKRRRETASLDLDPDLLSLASRAQKLRENSSAQIAREEGQDNAQEKSSDDHSSRISKRKIPSPRQESTQGRTSPEQNPSPLQLSTLASVTGLNATRNKQVNILAMVEYVSSSTVKPTTAPLKRDIRLVDPSTDKKVTLSVFVDPVYFFPKKYDIMLFRNLTTHDFSGGNLNAYPKKCRGQEWCVLDPYDIEECDMKCMEIFRAKYRQPKAQVPE